MTGTDDPKRRIVSIAVLPQTQTHAPTLYALGDDGSLFLLRRGAAGSKPTWEQLPDLPMKRSVS